MGQTLRLKPRFNTVLLHFFFKLLCISVVQANYCTGDHSNLKKSWEGTVLKQGFNLNVCPILEESPCNLSRASKHLLFTIYQNTSYYKCIWQQRRRFYYIGITKHLTKSLSAIVALEMRGCLYVNFLTAAECRIFLLKLWPPKQNRIFKKIWPWPNYTASGRPLAPRKEVLRQKTLSR